MDYESGWAGTLTVPVENVKSDLWKVNLYSVCASEMNSVKFNMFFSSQFE